MQKYFGYSIGILFIASIGYWNWKMNILICILCLDCEKFRSFSQLKDTIVIFKIINFAQKLIKQEIVRNPHENSWHQRETWSFDVAEAKVKNSLSIAYSGGWLFQKWMTDRQTQG